MRTLKKTLCMVLALVMMLGLCAFGTSAAFSDADKVTYKEAVDVLTGIGVIKGMGDAANTFNPDGTLTRAQACTIITKLMGGDGISAKSTFTDMAGAAWAESYVAYCQAKGIVGGYGDGRFGPNDTLTGSQWGRMLLLAAGFDAKTNGFESGNANWEIGVAKTVKDQKMAARISGFNGTQPITRDAACELAFQGMQKSPNGSAGYLVGDKFFADQLTAVLYLNTLTGAKPELVKAPAADSLMKTNFPGLKPTTGTDDFGRATTGWAYNAKNTGLAKDEVPVQSSAVPASYSLTVNGLNLLGVGDLGAYNGSQSKANFIAGLNKALGLTGSKELVAVDDLPVKKNGNTFTLTSDEVKVSDEIEIFLNAEGKIANVVIIRYEAVKIGKTTKLSTTEANSLVGTRAEGSTTKTKVGSYTVYDKLFAGNNFAEDDYALVAVAAKGNVTGKTNYNSSTLIADAKAVETVEGTITKNANGTLTVGGKAYAPSGISGTAIVATPVSADYNNTFILYLAQDGTYMAFEKKTDEADTSVVYAVAQYYKDIYTDGTEYTAGGARVYYVQCVNLNGEVVNYPVKAGGKDSKGNPTEPAFAAGLKVVTPATGVDDNNKAAGTQSYVTLGTTLKDGTASTTEASMSGKEASFTSGSNKFYTSAGQKVIFMSGTKDDLKVTVKTGKTEVKAATNTSCIVYGTGKVGSTNFNIQAIFVTAAADTSSTGTGLIYADGSGVAYESSYVDKTTGKNVAANVFNVWIDGEAKEIMTGEASIAAGVYEYKTDDDTGLYGSFKAYERTAVGKIKNNYNGVVDMADDATIGTDMPDDDIDLSKATLVNAINPFTKAEAAAACPSSVAELAKNATVTIVFSVNNGVKTATVVYVTDYPTA